MPQQQPERIEDEKATCRHCGKFLYRGLLYGTIRCRGCGEDHKSNRLQELVKKIYNDESEAEILTQ